MADGATAPGHAANMAGLEPGDGLLRRWLSLGFFQGEIAFALVRPLDVVVVASVLVEDPAQAAVSQEPAFPDALAFDRAHPSLSESIEVGTPGGNGDRLHAGIFEGCFPTRTEIRTPVMDDVLGSDLLQPAAIAGGIANRLNHELLVRVIGHSENLDFARGQMNGEQDIVTGGAEQTDDIDGEEIGRHEFIHLVGDERLPRRIGAALWSGLQTVAIQDCTDGSARHRKIEFEQFTPDASTTIPPTNCLVTSCIG